jgi:DNA-binding NtrC family response regulator
MFSGMGGLNLVVIASDEGRAQALGRVLRDAGHQVGIRTDLSGAMDLLGLAGTEVVVADQGVPGAVGPPEPLEAVEARHIRATLEFTGGNKRRAAALLGIARSTLIQKVRKYGIPGPIRGGE